MLAAIEHPWLMMPTTDFTATRILLQRTSLEETSKVAAARVQAVTMGLMTAAATSKWTPPALASALTSAAVAYLAVVLMAPRAHHCTRVQRGRRWRHSPGCQDLLAEFSNWHVIRARTLGHSLRVSCVVLDLSLVRSFSCYWILLACLVLVTPSCFARTCTFSCYRILLAFFMLVTSSSCFARTCTFSCYWILPCVRAETTPLQPLRSAQAPVVEYITSRSLPRQHGHHCIVSAAVGTGTRQ
jgi:hypothetical protein